MYKNIIIAMLLISLTLLISVGASTRSTVGILGIPTVDLTYNGTKVIKDLTAGETLAFNDSVYIKSDGKWWKTDADAEATSKCAGIAVSSASADSIVYVLMSGLIKDNSWSWTIGSEIYVSTDSGGLSESLPGAAKWVCFVGKALSSTVIDVDPSKIIIQQGP